MNDEQPTQPLTDAELAAIRTRFDNRNKDMRSWGPVTLFHAAREVPRLLAEVDRLRAELADVNAAVKDTGIMSTGAQGVRDIHLHFGQALQDNRALRAELTNVRRVLITAHEAGASLGRDVERLQAEAIQHAADRDAYVAKTIKRYDTLAEEAARLRSALTALGRNEQAAVTSSLELQEENERLRLEAVQMESGTHIAVDAGVAALQEVKRLEKTCANLKEINDRMAEDRLRLIDERDRLIAEREADSAVFMAHRAAFVRLQSERNALVAKLGLDQDGRGQTDA